MVSTLKGRMLPIMVVWKKPISHIKSAYNAMDPRLDCQVWTNTINSSYSGYRWPNHVAQFHAMSTKKIWLQQGIIHQMNSEYSASFTICQRIHLHTISIAHWAPKWIQWKSVKFGNDQVAHRLIEFIVDFKCMLDMLKTKILKMPTCIVTSDVDGKIILVQPYNKFRLNMNIVISRESLNCKHFPSKKEKNCHPHANSN